MPFGIPLLATMALPCMATKPHPRLVTLLASIYTNQLDPCGVSSMVSHNPPPSGECRVVQL